MTDTAARQNADVRHSILEPQEPSLHENTTSSIEQQPAQQQQPSALVRTARALKRTRARDILQDSLSEIPAEKRVSLPRYDLFDYQKQHRQIRLQTTPLRSGQNTPSTSQPLSSQPRRTATASATAATTATEAAVVDPAVLYGKTWKLHRTTPFFRYDPQQARRDASELLSYMTANASKLTMADAAIAQATATSGGRGSGGDAGENSHGSAASSIVTTAGGLMSALSITERASRPFPPQIDQDGENIVERVDVVNQVKSVVFQPLDLAPELAEEEEELEGAGAKLSRQQPGSNSFIISIVISYRGKAADQTSYIVIIDDASRETNGSTATKNSDSSPSFIHFSLLLAKASASLSALVMEWLERKYDCRICPLVFPTYELRSFVDHWLEYLYGRGSLEEMANDVAHHEIAVALRKTKVKQVELHYGFPAGVQGLTNMTVSLASEDVQELRLSRENNSEASLVEGIEDHCSDSMRIDFGRLILTRVGCPSWYIASEGKLKIHPVPPGKQSLNRLLQALIRHST